MDDFCTYILQSLQNQTNYVGYTSNLILRMEEHNYDEFDKTAYTHKGRPWIVVHVEFFASKKEAMSKEKQIKKRGAKRYLAVE